MLKETLMRVKNKIDEYIQKKQHHIPIYLGELLETEH